MSTFPIHARAIHALLLAFLVPAFVLPVPSAVTEAWVQRYNGPANHSDVPYAVAIDFAGNVAITGSSWNGSGSDVFTVKYAATNGAVLWTNRYDGPGFNSSDQAQDIAVDASGNVIVLNMTGTHNNFDFYTVKYAAADGSLLWSVRYNGPANQDDFPSAVAVDAGGNIVVTGGSDGVIGGSDYYTAKYSGTNGMLLWEKRYNFGASESAMAVAIDHRGNVIVTGFSDSDYYTAKYSGRNGALIWERRYTGPTNGANFDIAQAVAVDTAGNVFVTGYSVSSFGVTGFDYYTAKYAENSGAVLWEQRYNGLANGGDEAASIAVDGFGNAIVTGWSYNGTNYDYATVKYAAADGALLWERRFGASVTGDDLAYAVATDPSNNVVVTGRSDIGTNVDYYTASYAATDGAMLWERRYNGPANKFDAVISPHALAIGADGRVAVTGVSAGNIGVIDFSDFATVVYRENLVPLIVCPGNITTNCGGNGQAIVNFTVDATDESGFPPFVVCSAPSGSAFPLGETTVTCTAMDSDQLSNTCTFTVAVLDLVPPAVNCPSNQTLEFITDQGAVAEYSVPVEDLCDSMPLRTCVPPSGTTFPIGETIVRAAARDASGNSNACTFTVTVLGARGTKYNRLTDLVDLLPDITNHSDRQKLESAIRHLINSLEPRRWIDEVHVTPTDGTQVFLEEMLAARDLCALSLAQADSGAHEIIQHTVDRIIQSDRLLAFIAIRDATDANVPPNRIALANQFLLRADRATEEGKCNLAIELYGRAWGAVR